MTGKTNRSPERVNTPQSERALRSLDFSQTLLLTQTVQVAVGLFSLPRVVSEEAHHSGWMAILISGVLIQLALLMIILLMRRFGTHDLYGILRIVYGKWIGLFLGGLFALYCVCAVALVSRTYIELLLTWLFPSSKPYAFFLLLMMPCLYVATGGIRVLGRFGVITFFVTFWMMFLLAGPIAQIQPEYYFPIFDTSIGELVRATWKVSASAIGFELILVYYPFIQNKKKALLATSIGTWLTTFIYFTVTVVAIGFYSEGEIQHIISPALHMFKTVELPIIERLEHIGVSTWSFLIVNTASTYLWAAGRFLKSCTDWKESTCIYAFLPIVIVLGLFTQDTYLLDKFELILGSIGGVVAVVFPTLVLLSAILLRKKGNGEDPASNNAPQEANAS